MRTALAWLVLASPAAAEGPFRDLAFAAALEAAGQESKVVMVDFFTTWCPPCKLLDQKTWKDEQVVAWLGERTVALKIDAEQEVELAKRYAVEAYPTLLFARADGTEIGRIVGYRDPAGFLEEAADTLSGKSPVERAKEKLAGHENDPMARIQYADVLAQAGLDEEALREYLWCWDHGLEHSPSFVGVRGSFLLADLVQLGRKYPPALAALAERRDAAMTRIEPGADWSPALRDFMSLDEQLRASSKAVALWDRLVGREDAAPIRRVLVGSIAGALVEARRYADVLGDAPNVADWLRGELARLAGMGDHGLPGEELEGMTSYMKSQVLQQAGTWYEALAGAPPGANQPSVAEFELQVLAVDAGSRTYARLIEHAVRAGAAERAQALSEKALATFTERSDRRRIERAARPPKGADPEE